jgi:hypothetical protein
LAVDAGWAKPNALAGVNDLVGVVVRLVIAALVKDLFFR